MTEVNVFENYASKDFDVCFQNDVKLDTGVDVRYIKSGEDDIKYYVETTAKPEIDAYTAGQNAVLSSVAAEYEEKAEEIAGQCRGAAETAAQKAAEAETQAENAADAAQSVSSAAANALADINSAVTSGLEQIESELEQIVTVDGEQTISGNKLFSGVLQAVTAASSDVSTKVATTAFVNGGNVIAKSNNYIKFASGLIMQWGRAAVENGAASYTYKQPFTTTSYCITTARSSTTTATAGIYTLLIREYTTTGFKCYSTSGAGWFWLAVSF